jgi:hypothetical protein
LSSPAVRSPKFRSRCATPAPADGPGCGAGRWGSSGRSIGFGRCPLPPEFCHCKPRKSCSIRRNNKAVRSQLAIGPRNLRCNADSGGRPRTRTRSSRAEYRPPPPSWPVSAVERRMP